MSKELEILLSNVDACGQRIEKLVYSLNKNRTIFPLSVETLDLRQELEKIPPSLLPVKRNYQIIASL